MKSNQIDVWIGYSIAAEIKRYLEMLLFCLTDTKNEHLNLLKSYHHFDKIDIDASQADKMTDNQ